MTQNKISFCTVCMNRLNHLKKTLPENIKDNKDFKNIEFILLDYNSTDGLEDYIKQYMVEEISSGKLVYYKTLTPIHFDRSHSRNLAFKLSTGNIICNLDADNFTGKNFAFYINEQFLEEKNIFLTTFSAESAYQSDVFGRICLEKKNFLKIRGLDERMKSYGFEDFDFSNRLKAIGLRPVLISKRKGYLHAITHNHSFRLKNESRLKNIDFVLINHIDPSLSDFIIIYRNESFERFKLFDVNTLNILKSKDLEKEKKMELLDYSKGRYDHAEDCIRMRIKGDIMALKHEKVEGYYFNSTNKNEKYFIWTDKKLVQMVVYLFSQLLNRVFVDRNKLENIVIVNKKTFGRDVVYKNFDYLTPITIK